MNSDSVGIPDVLERLRSQDKQLDAASKALAFMHAEIERLKHNNVVLTDALWKASGDDEECVNEYIASQGELL